MGSEYIDPVKAGREDVAASGLDPAELVTYDYVGGQACKMSRIEAVTRGVEHWTDIDGAPQWARDKIVRAAAGRMIGANPSVPILTQCPELGAALTGIPGAVKSNPGPAQPIGYMTDGPGELASMAESLSKIGTDRAKWSPPRVTLSVDAREIKAVRGGCRTANPYPLGGSPSPACAPAVDSEGQGSDSQGNACAYSPLLAPSLSFVAGLLISGGVTVALAYDVTRAGVFGLAAVALGVILLGYVFSWSWRKW